MAISGGGVSFNYSFQPWCSLAATIKPIIISAALFSSVLIVLSAKQQ